MNIFRIYKKTIDKHINYVSREKIGKYMIIKWKYKKSQKLSNIIMPSNTLNFSPVNER